LEFGVHIHLNVVKKQTSDHLTAKISPYEEETATVSGFRVTKSGKEMSPMKVA
jgi:autonomous glycyl radical cofactor GrcA